MVPINNFQIAGNEGHHEFLEHLVGDRSSPSVLPQGAEFDPCATLDVYSWENHGLISFITASS